MVLPQSAEEMTDILDIEGLAINPMAQNIRYALSLLAIILLVLILFWLVKALIKKIKSKLKKITPEEKALKKLADLKKKNLLEGEQSHQFYFILDQVYRFYLLEKFNFDVTEKTLEQIKQDLKSFKQFYNQSQLKYYEGFLDRAQIAKFAKFPVDQSLAKKDFKFISDFIERTKKESLLKNKK